MNIINKNIDAGKAFDWGRTSSDYARFRDIYPQEFYDRILQRNLCISGQKVLDLGTGTDISDNQIAQARRLSEGMDIQYVVCAAEEIDFPNQSFDVITACQCFWYFDHERILPKLSRMLKDGGSLLLLYMAWLPYEDAIAESSEKLVLKYNPDWSGAGEAIHAIDIPDCCNKKFQLIYHDEYPIKVHFTRESWHGRMKACRGIGASLPDKEIAMWEKEHKRLLAEIAPEEFDVLHYGAMAELKKI